MPYLLTVFFFVWINNLLGLIPIFPGGANLTGNIAVTMMLALCTFVLTTINGNKNYWGHVFTPHVPWWLYPLMIPVEIIGLFTKPIALMIRLFANITAGHILILSLISLIFIIHFIITNIINSSNYRPTTISRLVHPMTCLTSKRLRKSDCRTLNQHQKTATNSTLVFLENFEGI